MAGQIEFPAAEVEGSITARLARLAELVPEAPALSDGSSPAVGFQELHESTAAAARWLLDRHGAGTAPIALLMDHAPEAIVAQLAVIGAGRAVMPLDPTHPVARLEEVLAAAQPVATLATGAHVALARALEGTGTVHAWDDPPALPGPTPTPDPASAAFLLFTSGSTGRPKGAGATHRAFLNGARALALEGVFGPGDKVVMMAPMSTAAAGAQTMWVLLAGAELAPFPVRERGMGAFLAWLPEAGITALPTQASLARAIAGAVAPAPVPSLRTVMVGGEMIHPSDLEPFRGMGTGPVDVVPVYVSTEMMLMAWDRCGPDVDPVELDAIRLRRGVEGVRLDVEPLDEDDDEVGEIVVRALTSSTGYWGDPDLTADRFTFDRAAGEMTYRTGDLARRGVDGLEIVGRRDSMVKVRGSRVELGAVEHAATGAPSVAAAAVVAVGAEGDLALVAHVSGAPGAPRPDGAAVRAHLRANLPSPMVPRSVHVHDELPRLPNGKVDRVGLLAASAASAPERTRPPTDLEARLLKELQRLAPIGDDVGVDQDLLEAGVDSLAAIELLVHIEKELGVSLPMSAWLTLTTIEDIAAAVTAGLPDESGSVVLLQSGVTTGPTLVVLNDLHGSAFRMRELAAAVGPDVRVWGTDSPFLDGRRHAPGSVEELAAVHVSDLLATMPDGPIHLVGYSSATLVAYEVAVGLRRAGREVGLVGLIDFGPVHVRHRLRRGEGPRPPGGWAVRARSDAPVRDRAVFHLDRLRQAPPVAWPQVLSRTFDVARQHDMALARLDLARSGRVRPELRGAWAWYRQMDLAIDYQPPASDLRVTLFRSDVTARGHMDVSRRLDYASATDETFGWAEVARSVTVVPVTGHHNDLVEPPNVVALGQRVRKALDAAT